MDRIGAFVNSGTGFALKSTGPGHNATTVLPFNIINFDASSFTYTLEAMNYQASPLVSTTNIDCSYILSLSPLIFTWVVEHACKQALVKSEKYSIR